MPRILITAIAILSVSATSAMAVCESSFVNPLHISWPCMFPIRAAGIRISPDGPEPDSHLSTPLCSCQDGAFQRVGLVLEFSEPALMVDVVKDAWCFAGFGVDMGSSSVWGNGSSVKDEYRSEFSGHSHSYFYNPLMLMEILLDAKCLDKMTTGISDLSEVRPEHFDVTLNLMLYPQTLLFANPVATMACSADAVSASAGYPLDALFWCSGEWGPIYPLTGTSSAKGDSNVRAAANVAAKSIARSHQNLLLWGTKGAAALCGQYPQPVWMKTQYKLQPVRPVRSALCPTVGRTELLWGAGMNPPNGKGDNFSYILWRKRTCCSF
jgi:conjugal transfer pilus assembly protein TraU